MSGYSLAEVVACRHNTSFPEVDIACAASYGSCFVYPDLPHRFITWVVEGSRIRLSEHSTVCELVSNILNIDVDGDIIPTSVSVTTHARDRGSKRKRNVGADAQLFDDESMENVVISFATKEGLVCSCPFNHPSRFGDDRRSIFTAVKQAPIEEFRHEAPANARFEKAITFGQVCMRFFFGPRLYHTTLARWCECDMI